MSTLLSFVAALVIIVVVDVVVVVTSGLPPDWLKVDVDSSEPP